MRQVPVQGLEWEKTMKTRFQIEGRTFNSKEDAVRQLSWWKNVPTFSVRQIQNVEVTRKTRRGDIITEIVHDGIEQVPGVISSCSLDPTYSVVSSGRSFNVVWEIFPTVEEAEQERAKRQSSADKLAALTEADIQEIKMPTLADILERDADEISALSEEASRTKNDCEFLVRLAEAHAAPQVADLESQIAAVKAKTAAELGLQQVQEKARAAAKAYNDAIHYDQFSEQAAEALLEEHHDNCWPNSDCRQCDYEPDEEEIEEYLLEHAEEFEIRERA